MEIRISNLIGGAFTACREAVRNGASEIMASGGRGSGKSSYISMEFLLQLLKHPSCHGLVCRKVGATLRASVFAQLQWAVEVMGLLGTLAGSFLGVLATSKLTQYRLQQLEEKVAQHNHIIERTYILEGQMTEVQHDIRDLKQKT